MSFTGAENTTPEKLRSQWLRFSLRTLCLLTIVSSILLAWLNLHIQPRIALFNQLHSYGDSLIQYRFDASSRESEWMIAVYKLFGLEHDVRKFYGFEFNPTNAPEPLVMENVEPFKLCENAGSFHFNGVEFTDLKSIDGFPNLERLKLENCETPHLQYIGDLPKLYNLHIFDLNAPDLRFGGLPQLGHLTATNLAIADWSWLGECSQLQSANLNGSSIDDLSHLRSSLKTLDTLYIRDTKIKSLGPLAGCKRMCILDISGTSISSLEPLKSHTDLLELNLRSCPISVLTPLNDKKNLFQLDISRTAVTDLSPLYQCDFLYRIKIDGTAISGAEIESFRRALPNCRIEGSKD